MAPDAELVLLFACPEAAACVTGESWRTDAIQSHGIRVEIAEIDTVLRAGIRESQDRQRMVKPM